MTITQDITEFQVFSALRAGIEAITGQPVYKGLSNEVPMPAVDYIVLNPVMQVRHGTNETEYEDNIDNLIRHESVQYDYIIQIDCYGNNSGNTINIINLLFRSDYFDSSGIVPFYTSEPRQLTWEDSTRLMVERWHMDLHISYNPTASIETESAIELNVTVNNPINYLP